MKKCKLVEGMLKISETTIVDLRTFRENRALFKNSIWFGIQGLQTGWIDALLNKNDPFSICIE